MRGKPGQTSPLESAMRIIPAHAGQTPSPRVQARQLADHPRACGANSVALCRAAMMYGSSPRMRGKRPEHRGPNGRGRIIPAHAGQTHSGHAAFMLDTDHPRACGANPITRFIYKCSSGSSPRMRGKHVTCTCPLMSKRIIPAHAGQTVRFYAKTLERWTLNNWIRTVAPIFVLLFLPPVIGQNAYIERHYSNQSFSWFSKLHYASAFDLSLVA